MFYALFALTGLIIGIGLTSIVLYKFYTKEIAKIEDKFYGEIDRTWNIAFAAGECHANEDPENIKKRYKEMYDQIESEGY